MDRSYWHGQLVNEVRNYNRRVRAAIKRGLDPAIAPQTYTSKEIEQHLSTAKDYRRAINRLKGATADTLRETKKGGNTIYGARYKIAPRNTIGDAQIAPVPPEPVGPTEFEKLMANIDLAPEAGRLPSERKWIADKIGLEPGDIDNAQKMHDWLNTGNNLYRVDQWRQNYLKAILNSLEAFQFSWDQESIELLYDLYRKISSIDLERFLAGQLLYGGHTVIDYIYPRKGVSAAPVYEDILYYWDKVT